MPQTLSTYNPWLGVVNALRDQLAPGNPWTGIQYVSAPTVADWNDPTNGPYLASTKWGDHMPVFSPVYRPTARSAAEAYYAFLKNITIDYSGTTAQIQAAQNAQAAYTKSVEDFQAYMQQVFNDFLTAKSVGAATNYKSWLASSGNGSVVATHRMLLENSQLAFVKAYQACGTSMQDVGQALLDYNNPAYQVDVQTPFGYPLQMRPYSISPSLDTFMAESKKGTGNQLVIQQTQTSDYQDHSSYDFNAAASYSRGFWGASAAASGSAAYDFATSSSFAMTMKFANHALFTVDPGPWFHANILTTYGPDTSKWVSPTKHFFASAANNTPPFIFPQMPAQYLVVYQPEIEIVSDQAQMTAASTQWAAQANVNVGGFNFNGGASGQTSEYAFDSAGSKVTLKSTSEQPMVMAVINNIMPSFGNVVI